LDKDRLINLLPEEYLPEPEFKAFPFFAAGAIILTVLFIFLAYQKDSNYVNELMTTRDSLTQSNQGKVVDANQFTDIQANARFIASYLAVIPNMVLQAPDYWEIYNTIEELLPEDTWVRSITFRSRPKTWPDLILDCVSRGYSYNGPLVTYDRFKGTSDNPTRFANIRMGGYQRAMVDGSPGVSFQIQMEIRYPTE
jgi:hypothetical protein